MRSGLYLGHVAARSAPLQPSRLPPARPEDDSAHPGIQTLPPPGPVGGGGVARTYPGTIPPNSESEREGSPRGRTRLVVEHAGAHLRKVKRDPD